LVPSSTTPSPITPRSFSITAKALEHHRHWHWQGLWRAGSIPHFHPVTGGLIAGDSITSITETRAAGESAGTLHNYPSAAAGVLDPSNYTITYNTAPFSITAKSAGAYITATATGKVYGG
jgi:hypothetical protein